MSVGYLKKCSNGRTPKQRFKTQQLAEGFRKSMIAVRKWTDGGSNTYWCNVCGLYHAGALGKANRGRGRKVAAKNRPRHLDSQ